jgi:copper/silver efflux system protein
MLADAIRWLISASARHPWTTIGVVLVGAVAGWISLLRTPLDALPDLSDTQVVILTEWEGQSPDLVESQITTPISSALLGAPRVQFVRGQSMFGLSFVYVIFDEGTDLYWARSRVLEYLSSVQGSLPEGANPMLGPDATSVGWVFQYALVDESGEHDLQSLRAYQDWTLRYALASVPGVAEVASVGGIVKQFQIQVDPMRLVANGITLEAVIDAVRASNEDAGGSVLDIAGQEHVIRGRGLVRSLDDLRETVVDMRPDGTPVLLGQVAEVGFGPEERRGVADLDGKGEVTGGIVVMRYGENALEVIRRVKARIEETPLPPGVRLQVTYDRSELIEAAIRTLQRTLVEEMLVVSAVIVLFLLHARSALIPILTLPVAVLLAFVPMSAQGLGANIMSLGGIAVAIGAMVDASIILVENVHKRRETHLDEDPTSAVVTAMREVGPTIFLSLLVLTVSFLPVFTLEATEGRLFKPLAYTKTWAMAFSALLAVTLTPALAVLLLRGPLGREDQNPLNRWLVRAYEPIVRFVVRRRWPVIGAATLLVLATIPAALSLESEFMPPLHEGTLLHMPTAPPGMSIAEASAVLRAMDAKIKSVPEVRSVFGKMGRADTSTDPAPLGMAETTIVLAPREEWRPGLTWDDLVKELDHAVHVPGMPNLWWMPIQTRTEMLATGVRSPVAVQVLGDDLATIEATALEIERAVARVPGTRSAVAERSIGGFYVDVAVDRAKAARSGLTVAAINDVVRTAVGGMEVDEVLDGRARYPVNVRYARELRDSADSIDDILVATPSGAQIPLGQIASVTHTLGPPMIRSEGGKLVSYVFVDPGEVPVGTWVERAAEVLEGIALPPTVRVEWTGQHRYLVRAQEKLALVVPLTLGLAAFLLYANTRSWVETAIVLTAVPFSLVGAVWILVALDYHVSVAVWVGAIALAGLDAETGVVMLLYLTLAHDAHRPKTEPALMEAIVEGAARRIRPKLMTVLTAMIGLAPILWSTGTGADVMKRIAAPMVGGLATSFLLELAVYPAIFAVWKSRSLGAARRK